MRGATWRLDGKEIESKGESGKVSFKGQRWRCASAVRNGYIVEPVVRLSARRRSHRLCASNAMTAFAKCIVKSQWVSVVRRQIVDRKRRMQDGYWVAIMQWSCKSGC